MMDRKKCTEGKKMMAKKEIKLDIYGQRRGTLYEYGLAESSDEEEFCGKLNSLQQKGKAVVKDFSIGFVEIANKSLLIRSHDLLAMDRMWMDSSIKTT